MDNVGDWIYIVFLIVAAISGLFSSKNKKKAPDTSPRTARSRLIPGGKYLFGKRFLGNSGGGNYPSKAGSTNCTDP